MAQTPAARTPLAAISRIFGIEAREFGVVALSFLYFFTLLSSYYIMRSVREAMAIEGGTQNIKWLFTGTFVSMLVATSIFGWVASRFPRKQFLPWVYYFFIADILLFFAGFRYAEWSGMSMVWIGRSFFVWLSVFNLFVVSVFWSFMADIYSKEQSRRLFGFISAGGSIGALVGPLITSAIVVPLGFENLLLISAVLLCGSVFCVFKLRDRASSRVSDGSAADSDKPIGGSALAGIRLVATSPYIAAIAGALVIACFLGAALYMYMAQIVEQAFDSTDQRTQVYAMLDAATNVLSFIGQLLIVRYSVRRAGVGLTLAVLPIVSVAGFALLALHPVFAVIAAFQVLRRSVTFGLTKPTTDMLYSVVSPEARYKAKNVVETAIYRGGDMISTWIISAIAVIGLTGVSWVCVPLSILWAWLSFVIGRKYLRRDAELSK